MEVRRKLKFKEKNTRGYFAITLVQTFDTAEVREPNTI